MFIRKLVQVLFFLSLVLFGYNGVSIAQDEIAQGEIIYIPLDERPLNLDYVVDTAAAAGLPLAVPPRSLLPDYRTPAPADRLWQWLLENAPRASGLVLATDTLIYGGLLPSRNHDLPLEEVLARADKLQRLKEVNPRLRILAFATLMRAPAVNTAAEEPPYYGIYGAAIARLTALEYKQEITGLDTGEAAELAELRAAVPPAYLDDWLNRRAKNVQVTARLLELAREGVIDFFLLARDDAAPFSQSRREYLELARQAGGLTPERYVSFAGADEAGLILVTRMANELAEVRPGVYVEYAPGAGAATVPAYEDGVVERSIAAHVTAAGGQVVRDPARADLVLMVNTPPDGITREAAGAENAAGTASGPARFVERLKEHLGRGRAVALADIAFANGSDNALMQLLRQAGLLPRLTAYAGLNTAGNAIGYALGQGLLARGMDAGRRRALLAVRLLDDWGYQANVRGRVDREIIRPYGVDKNNPGAYADRIFTAIREGMARFARTHMDGFPINSVEISFPWNRTFNIGVKIR